MTVMTTDIDIITTVEPSDMVAVPIDGSPSAPGDIVVGGIESTAALDNDEAEKEEEKKRCCSALRFGGNGEAQGYALLTVARGGIIMSNIFLSTALIRLASESAGCIFYDDPERENPPCNNEVYGFRPSSLITMIAVVSGLISAFLLPVIGAIVDYTPHRKTVGLLSAAFITVVQGVQIWLTDDTWFAMSILQALNGFMYMVQTMAVTAYLPDLGRLVGAKKMTWYSALFSMCQFGAMALFLIINIALSTGFNFGDVATAQMSQAICVVWLLATFLPGWRKMPSIPALHARPAGKSLVRIGFSQVWHTVVGINKHYGSGLRWYFLGVVFAEAGANAFTVVAVTFMVEVLEMSGTEVGIVFLITLVSTIPGSKLGQWISKKTNPIISWKINLVVFSAVTAAGAFILTSPAMKNICYLFGFLWGVLLGWFYPLENVTFTMTVPKGQESELSGFYTYCRSIITWLPPLIFTIMNESGIDMKWGLFSLIFFLLTGLFFLQLMAPWEDVLEAAKKNKMNMNVAEGDSVSDTKTDVFLEQA